MESESSKSLDAPTANLIYPPSRTTAGGTAVIRAVLALLSTIMIVAHGFELRVAAAAVILGDRI